MTDDELLAIEARWAQAHPGPWTWGEAPWTIRLGTGDDPTIASITATPDDVHFVVFAHADLRTLLTAIRTGGYVASTTLRAIYQRAEAASPGPWRSRIEGRDHHGGSNVITTGGDDNGGEDIELSGLADHDQDFLAYARGVIPRLLDVLRRDFESGRRADLDHATAFLCGHVFENTRPVLLVLHEDDGWQLLCGDTHDDGPHVVHMSHLLERDPTLTELHDLPLDFEAERAAIGEPWHRQPLEVED